MKQIVTFIFSCISSITILYAQTPAPKPNVQTADSMSRVNGISNPSTATVIQPPAPYSYMSAEDYINKYKNIAIAEMQRTGVPASITLAQGLVETNAGNSNLARFANNHFGVKCHEDWTGAHYIQDDDRRNECFRKYDSAVQSFQDHSNFLVKHSRYSFLFALSPYDYTGWAYGLKQAGYATNPQYAPMLVKAIEENNLQQYDMSPEDWAVYKSLPVLDNTGSHEDSMKYAAFVNKSFDSNESRMFIFNGVKVVVAEQDETLGDIAQEFSIPVDVLLSYNDLSEPIALKPGYKVYLQPKRSTGSQPTAILTSGHSLWGMSQKYGIQLKYLYSRNLLKVADSIQTGEVIYLKDYRTTPPIVLRGQTLTPADSISIKVPATVVYTPPTPSKPNGTYQKGKRRQPLMYTVRKGDTLYGIAQKFHTDVIILRKKNNLRNAMVYPGQTLVIRK